MRFLPYQPRELLAQSLSAADLHYVGLAKGLSGYVVPSRLYGILRHGSPGARSCGRGVGDGPHRSRDRLRLVVPPGRPDVVATTLRAAVEGPLSLAGMGERGRAYVERDADREVAFDRYRRLFADVVASSSR